MFNSTSINGSPLGRNNKSTSPHFNNVSMITPNRSKRYSLADVSYTSTSYRNNSGSRYTTSSPVLLNNQSQPPQRSINRMLSTHIDSKSPGLTSRLVQYSKEKEQRSRPIIQSKYDKPGIFPIVHLFKKDVPVLKRKSNSSLSSPSAAASDLSRHNSLEHNKKLMETIVYPSPATKHENEVNTRSVLDALKEISRKRIHASETYHSHDDDDGKRMRIDSTPVYYKKRLREQSPQSEGSNSPKSPTAPVLDEVTASHSSMIGQKVEPRITHFRKKKNVEKIVPVVEKPKESKLVDVETQTVPEVVVAAAAAPTKTVEKKDVAESKKVVEKDVPVVVTPKKPPPMKIFDERPLEIMRRNRLSILMGLPVEKMESPSKILAREFGGGENNSEKSVEVDKPLVSILSGANKSPVKKHVSFDIVSESAPSPQQQAPSSPVKTTQSVISPTITQTSSSIVTPIVSAAITNLFNNETATSAPQPTAAAIKSSELTTAAPPTFNFTSNLKPTSPILPFTLNTNTTNATATTKGDGFVVSQPLQNTTFGSFSSPKTETAAATTTTTTTASVSSKEEKKTIGGFKFDLNSSVSVSSPSFKPIPSTTTTIATTTAASSGGFSFNSIPMVSSPISLQNNSNNSFSAKTTFSGFNNLTQTTTTASAVTLTPKSTSAFSVPTINFGSAIQSPPNNTSKAPGFSFGNNSSTSTTSFGTSSTFASSTFGKPTTPINFAKPNLPSFNAITTTSAPIVPSFGGGAQPQSNFTATGGFVMNKPASSGFGTTKPINFGATTTAAAAATATTSTAPPPAFASSNLFELKPKATSSTSAAASSIFPVFNSAATPSAPPPAFGATATASVPSISGGFNNANTNFGASIFNSAPQAATTTSNSTGMFGVAAAATTTTTTASTFSTGSTMFGSKSTVAGFDSSIFGGGAGQSAFGNSAIAATTTVASAFGTSGFGAGGGATATAVPQLPSSSNTTVPNSFNFGSTNTPAKPTPAFGSSTFGSKGFGGGVQTTSVGFGASPSASSGFGVAPFRPATATTTSINTFGSAFPSAAAASTPPTATFGSTTNNNNSNAPAFGASQSTTFGGNNNALFGNNNAFGTSSAFGGNQSNAFNASSAGTSGGFGGFNSSFGSNVAKPAPTPGGEVFTFGSSAGASNKSGAVFSFGGNNNEPVAKPSFNFAPSNPTGGANSSGGFGGMNGSGFGSMPPPAFGAPSQPSAVAGSSSGGGAGGFGSLVQPTGMFSIGSGGSSTPTRSRNQIKAKRRT